MTEREEVISLSNYESHSFLKKYNLGFESSKANNFLEENFDSKIYKYYSF